AQPAIGEILFALRRRRVELRAALEDLVDELLVFAAAAAQQELQVFERRRLDPAKAIALVGGQDRRGGAVAELHLRREHVLHAARRRRVELHARSDPATDMAAQAVASAVG